MVRVAIIGYGYWGPNLVRNFSTLEQVEIVAVCDLVAERLKEVKRKYPAIEVSKNFVEILEDTSINAVVIATPLSTHFSLAKKALQAGMHVWVEKPLTATSVQAHELIRLAKAKNKILNVDHIFVYTEAVAFIKNMITSGKLGKLYYFDSTRINLGLFQPDTNVIWDLATHDISIMCYLLESMPESVSTIAASHIIKGIEDTADLNFRMNHMSAHIRVSWLSPVKIRRTIVAGTKKMIVYDDLETSEKIKVYDYGVSANKKSMQMTTGAYQYRTGDIYSPALKTTETLVRACQSFIDSINGSKPTITSGTDGLKVVKILEALTRSMKQNGRFVRLLSL